MAEKMKRHELSRIVDYILEVAESDRDEDIKIEIICEELIDSGMVELED